MDTTSRSPGSELPGPIFNSLFFRGLCDDAKRDLPPAGGVSTSVLTRLLGGCGFKPSRLASRVFHSSLSRSTRLASSRALHLRIFPAFPQPPLHQKSTLLPSHPFIGPSFISHIPPGGNFPAFLLAPPGEMVLFPRLSPGAQKFSRPPRAEGKRKERSGPERTGHLENPSESLL